MGKKLDSLLLRRSSKTSKLESLANIAISRLTILKNQHHVRFSHAQSDVIQLLNHGDQASALLRVEYVIKEQNAIDAFVMIESYCRHLIDCAQLFQNIRQCPDKLKDTISSLIFASSRCGEFPELQKIRENLASQFGKEFEACVVELRNSCGVNPKMIQTLSTRQASLESRQKLLVQIALGNGIPLNPEDDTSDITQEREDGKQKEKRLEPNEAVLDAAEDGVAAQDFLEEIAKDEHISDSMKARNEYRDVAAAEQEVFDGSESSDEDPDDHYGSNHQGTFVDSNGSLEPKLHVYGDAYSEDIKYSEKRLGLSKIHPIERFGSESEGEETTENSNTIHLKGMNLSNNRAGQERTLSPSEFELNYNDETMKKPLNNRWSKRIDTSSDRKSDLPLYEFSKVGRYKYTYRPTDTSFTVEESFPQ